VLASGGDPVRFRGELLVPFAAAIDTGTVIKWFIKHFDSNQFNTRNRELRYELATLGVTTLPLSPLKTNDVRRTGLGRIPLVRIEPNNSEAVPATARYVTNRPHETGSRDRHDLYSPVVRADRHLVKK